MKTYSFTYMNPFQLKSSFLPNAILTEDARIAQNEETPCEVSYTYEIDTKSSKFESREHSHILELSSQNSPWGLKFENTIRKNLIDQDASKNFLLYESLPSLKYSTSLSFMEMTHNSMTRGSLELALPLIDDRSPSFLKLELKHQQRWNLI